MYRNRNTMIALVCLALAASAFALDPAAARGMGGHSGMNGSNNNHTTNTSFVTTTQPATLLPPRMRNSPQTPPNGYVPPFISVAGAGN